MIEESGTVVELRGKHVALVICKKSSFCKNCASMESCHIGSDNRTMSVEAQNNLGAQVGDSVKIQTSSKHFLQSSFLLYILPLVGLVAGALLGKGLGERFAGGMDPDLLSALMGTGFLVGAFLLIKIASRAIPKDSYMPRITEIIIGD